MAEKETFLMKKAIIALIALLIAAGGSVGAYLAVKNSKEKETAQSKIALAENDLFRFDSDSPTQIIFSKGSESYTADYDGETWTLEDGEFDLDQTFCQLICTYLCDLTATTNYGEITDEKLEMYGLNDADTIQLTTPDGVHTLCIGDLSPTGDVYYVTADDRGKIFGIDSTKASVLKLDRLLLKNKSLLSYTLYDLKEVIVEKDGVTTCDLVLDEDSQLWSFTDKYASLPIDVTAVTSKLNSLVRLEADEMLDEKLDNPEKYGFDKPYAEVTVKALDNTQEHFSIAYNEDEPTYCLVLMDDGQVQRYYKSSLSIADSTPYDFMVKSFSAAYFSNTESFSLKYNDIDDKFSFDFDNMVCKVNGKEVSLESAEVYSALNNLFNSAAIFEYAGIDVDAEPELKDPVFSSEINDTDNGSVKLDLVKRDDKTCYFFIDGKYTGTYVDESKLKGRNSLGEFYVKFTKLAGLE